MPRKPPPKGSKNNRQFGPRRIDGQLLAYLILAPLFIIGAHSDNIARLRAGTERRLGSGES